MDGPKLTPDEEHLFIRWLEAQEKRRKTQARWRAKEKVHRKAYKILGSRYPVEFAQIVQSIGA